MSDDEDVEQFETADSGASTTIPMQAGNVRKGGFMVIKGRPTKVIEVTTSKTGKHGHAKCHFTATDIFTGKKMEELVPSSHNLEVLPKRNSSCLLHATCVLFMIHKIRESVLTFCCSGTHRLSGGLHTRRPQ